MKRHLIALCALALTACSSTVATEQSVPPSTTIRTPSDAGPLINALATDFAAFSCHIGSITVASRATSSLADSYFRSQTDDLGNGLEILTLDGISYARFTGPLLSGSSESHVSARRLVESNWATAGIPDTITLEELPATPLGCLEWASIPQSAIIDVRKLTDGSTEFLAKTGDGTATGLLDPQQQALTVTLNGETLLHIDLTDPLDAFPAVSPPGVPAGSVVEIDQDTYQALVGG